MKGNRKVFLGVLYLIGVFAIGGIVAWRAPHELAVAGAYALGAATGLGTVMWGNAKEHEFDAKPPVATTGPNP